MGRDEALLAGLKTYEDGKPCKHGHVGPRFVSNRSCTACSRRRTREDYDRHVDIRRERGRAGYWKNPERGRENSRAWSARNRDVSRVNSREWAKKNPDQVRHHFMKRHATKLRAMLPGHEVEIKEIYRTCPDGFQVDHEVPLQGRLVCGLHVPWNLKHLSEPDNKAKGNTFDPVRYPGQGRLGF